MAPEIISCHQKYESKSKVGELPTTAKDYPTYNVYQAIQIKN